MAQLAQSAQCTSRTRARTASAKQPLVASVPGLYCAGFRSADFFLYATCLIRALSFWYNGVIYFLKKQCLIILYAPLFYSSNKILKTQNEHLIIIFQNLIGM
jgi:hypothetical protein